MNVACDDVLLQPNEDSSSYLKNEKYYSFNNIRRKSLKNSEQEEKCLNRIKRFILFLNKYNHNKNIHKRHNRCKKTINIIIIKIKS